MKYSVCAVTGSRAEYGILRPLLLKLNQDLSIQFQLVVTGTHLSEIFGKTEVEILRDGFQISKRITIPTEIETKLDMISATSVAISEFGKYFSQNPPDLLVVLGDRYEIFGAVFSAAMLGIPVAHLHGGESTEGAVDEFLRHSITKMSTLHFTACEQYRRRVIQLGEAPDRVFAYGALSAENALNVPIMSLEELQNSIGHTLRTKKFCAVTFHPVTLENNTVEGQMRALIQSLEQFSNYDFIITKSNADSGGLEVNRIWDQQGTLHPNWVVVASLGMHRYLSALHYAAAMIGNSSSGIVEGPAMKLPTVNIGDRQRGRMMAESVISCAPVKEEITSAIRRALSSEMQKQAANIINPFGGTNVSDMMLKTIKDFLSTKKHWMKKSFYDLV